MKNASEDELQHMMQDAKRGGSFLHMDFLGEAQAIQHGGGFEEDGVGFSSAFEDQMGGLKHNLDMAALAKRVANGESLEDEDEADKDTAQNEDEGLGFDDEKSTIGSSNGNKDNPWFDLDIEMRKYKRQCVTYCTNISTEFTKLIDDAAETQRDAKAVPSGYQHHVIDSVDLLTTRILWVQNTMSESPDELTKAIAGDTENVPSVPDVVASKVQDVVAVEDAVGATPGVVAGKSGTMQAKLAGGKAPQQSPGVVAGQSNTMPVCVEALATTQVLAPASRPKPCKDYANLRTVACMKSMESEFNACHKLEDFQGVQDTLNVFKNAAVQLKLSTRHAIRELTKATAGAKKEQDDSDKSRRLGGDANVGARQKQKRAALTVIDAMFQQQRDGHYDLPGSGGSPSRKTK